MEVTLREVGNVLTRTSGYLKTVTSHSLQPYRGCSFGNSPLRRRLLRPAQFLCDPGALLGEFPGGPGERRCFLPAELAAGKELGPPQPGAFRAFSCPVPPSPFCPRNSGTVSRAASWRPCWRSRPTCWCCRPTPTG